MKIWVYTIIRDEEELLPFFFRHYQRIAERIIVYDDESTDRSAEIISSFGGERRILPYRGLDDSNQAVFSSLMYHEARGHADFVIVVDADELLYGTIDPSWTFPKADGFSMYGESVPSGGLLTDQIRRGVPQEIGTKPCLFRPELDLWFTPGRHGCNLHYQQPNTSLALLHYRWFGEEWAHKRNARNVARLTGEARLKRYGNHLYPENEATWLAWLRQEERRATDIVSALDQLAAWAIA